jgi:tetratricopeptide (TPR) repeat protein
LGLAQLSADSKQWQSVVDISNKLLALNSVDFPMAWLLNAAAQYNLGNLDAAEKSVQSGVKADSEHRYPRMEHLWGIILVSKHDYPQAAEHLRQFLRLSTQPNETAEAQKQLQQIEQASAGAVLAPQQQ